MVDYRGEEVTARLKAMGELSRLSSSPRRTVPMDRDSVTARLREMSDLLRFCVAVRKIGAPATPTK